ncbi:MAG TPA: phospholipase D-like domain-containing protein, partial [Burkholderiaceae bacterium]|nr:phospholipase D-like domain-containing protein [Burkholderiaceae bacterium]
MSAASSTLLHRAVLRGLGVLAIVAWSMLSAGCASLPDLGQRPYSEAVADVADTSLARLAAASTPDDMRHLSGLRLMPNGPEALAARMALARRAQRSLDVQYYVIAADASGRQFLRELRDAAQRGVRVRLLVDDLHAGDLDELLLGLAAHPNVQVRLFNPLPVRAGVVPARLLLSLSEFDRVNRRMHNKLFIADNSIAVTGGRNIANEYFMRSESANFIDMDLLSVGPVVRGLSDVFDRYWNSEPAYPIESLMHEPADAMRAAFDAWIGAQPPLAALGGLAAQLSSLPAVPLRFAPVSVLADEPSKASAVADAVPTAMNSALLTMVSAKSEVTIVSPYFV